MAWLAALQPHLPILVVLLPLAGALLAALVRVPAASWPIAMATSLAAAAAAVALGFEVAASGVVSYRLGSFPPELGIEYRIDAVNSLVLVVVAGMALVTLAYARRSVAADIDDGRQPWFYTLMLVAVTGLAGMAVTGDAFNVFVFLEISSLATYALIALGRDRRALVAAYQYLIVGTIGATFYVIGVGLLYLATGTLNLQLMTERLADVASPRALVAAEAFILVGLALKLALFPLHAWLPNAYACAPSAATVLIASTATKIALYVMARFLFGVFGVQVAIGPVPAASVLILLSLAAMFVASVSAVFQRDARRLLALSSVGQIGTITLGLALANPAGVTGAFLHLVNHAMMKGAAFMAIGAMLQRCGSDRLDDLAGIGRAMPLTAAALTVAGLALVGVPGTSGFVSKWYLVLGAFEAGKAWLAILIVASSLVAVLYVGRMLEIVWFREPAGAARAAREAPPAMLVPMLILSVMTVAFGIDATLPARMAGAAAATLLGTRP